MFDQVSDYFDPIFEDLLCAFCKNYSCQSTLIKAIDDWKVSLDRNQMVETIFMDLSKAFAYPMVWSLPSSMHMV